MELDALCCVQDLTKNPKSRMMRLLEKKCELIKEWYNLTSNTLRLSKLLHQRDTTGVVDLKFENALAELHKSMHLMRRCNRGKHLSFIYTTSLQACKY